MSCWLACPGLCPTWCVSPLVDLLSSALLCLPSGFLASRDTAQKWWEFLPPGQASGPRLVPSPMGTFLSCPLPRQRARPISAKYALALLSPQPQQACLGAVGAWVLGAGLPRASCSPGPWTRARPGPGLVSPCCQAAGGGAEFRVSGAPGASWHCHVSRESKGWGLRAIVDILPGHSFCPEGSPGPGEKDPLQSHRASEWQRTPVSRFPGSQARDCLLSPPGPGSPVRGGAEMGVSWEQVEESGGGTQLGSGFRLP